MKKLSKQLISFILNRDKLCTVKGCGRPPTSAYVKNVKERITVDNVAGICDECKGNLMTAAGRKVKNPEKRQEQRTYSGLRWQQWVYGGQRNPFMEGKK
jgi:hypothetical protein